MAVVVRGNLLQSMMTLFFMFSTVYTIIYLYQLGSNEDMKVPTLGDSDTENPPSPATSWWTSIISIGFDDVLEILSLFNPFIIVKGILYMIMPDMVYTITNMLLLRPIGWVVTFMEIDYVLNMIRGKSE